MHWRGIERDIQIPTSNIQRSSKVAKRRKIVAAQVRYDDASDVEATLLLNEAANGQPQHAFDLEERTAVFGERIIRFSKRIPRDPTNNRLINQLIGCGTSVGANYCEANEGVSGKDFRNIVGRCVKEAKETKYFLRMIAAAEPTLAATARGLYSEAKELHLIFASIFRKLRGRTDRS
jgi:four helix bundle protein